MNVLIRVVSVMSFTTLLGCAGLLSPYKKPLVNVPTQWHSRDQHAKVLPIRVNSLAWWEKFHDPQLNQLISEALLHSNDLGIATANILQAKASLERVNYSWLPRLDLGGLAFTTHLPEAIDTVPPAQNFDNAYVGFVPNYTLNVMRQVQNHKVAKLNLALQQVSKDAIRLALISQISGSYFSLLGIKQQIVLQQRLIDDVKKMRNYATIQYKNGAISPIKLVNLDQLIATLQKKIPTLNYDLVQTQNAIRVIINKNPGLVITHNRFGKINSQVIVPINIPAETLRARPDIAMAEYQLRISHALIGVEASKLFPTLHAAGFLGLAASGNIFTIGELVASMPFVALKTYADIAKAKGKKYADCYLYIKTVRHALAEIDNALSQHDTITQSYQQQLIAFSNAKKQHQIAQQQYQQGAISYAATLIYKLNMDYMEASLNECKMQQMRSIVMLYQSLGGGIFA